MPIKTGIVTIKNILEAISIKLILFCSIPSPKKLREVKTIKGIVITHKRLIIAVKEMESATSPLAKDVNIFDVAPPGAAAIIITPIAISGDIGKIKTKRKATIGRIMICEKAPRKKSFGCFKILVKSLTVSPIPNENIIKANARGKKISVMMPILI